ncbi:hypothetical protein OnM2_c5447o47 [Erysiphe neolycopersici]|uniref:Uncharacterized protein n=1 Tax=Erysiphe neolycopersici TaxID=212602 RepID=A0A420HPA8_9PEZI|nr:hypothetical protein OnM2_c5447o47 [Erysiphe neolycopersici]
MITSPSALILGVDATLVLFSAVEMSRDLPGPLLPLKYSECSNRWAITSTCLTGLRCRG